MRVITQKEQWLDSMGIENMELRRSASHVLMCPPDHFQVIDVKNPHMEAHQGGIDKDRAKDQWQKLREAFIKTGSEVFLLEAGPGLEDMVFTANPSFVGKDIHGQAVAVLSHMKHPSRRKEVNYFKNWFIEHGYRVEALEKEQGLFEGHGDAIWHPGRQLIWGGYGFRTDLATYENLADIFQCPVLGLKLENPHFYHLDTCFCPLDETTLMYYPPAFDDAGRALISSVFQDFIEVNETEAIKGFACNAWVRGRQVVIQQGNQAAKKALEEKNYEVIEVDTSEYMKSGGSVFCMKLDVY